MDGQIGWINGVLKACSSGHDLESYFVLQTFFSSFGRTSASSGGNMCAPELCHVPVLEGPASETESWF